MPRRKVRHKKVPDVNEWEWAFHKVDPSELAVCVRHEWIRGYAPSVQRARQGWQYEPWLKLSPAQREALADFYGDEEMKESPVQISTRKSSDEPGSLAATAHALYDYAVDLARKNDPLWKPPIEPVTLNFDWRKSDTKLLKRIRQIIRAERRRPFSPANEYSADARAQKTGRPRSEARRLVDIVLLRCQARGLTPSQTIKLIRPLLEHFEFVARGQPPSEGSPFSGRKLADTIREARDQIPP